MYAQPQDCIKLANCSPPCWAWERRRLAGVPEGDRAGETPVLPGELDAALAQPRRGDMVIAKARAKVSSPSGAAGLAMNSKSVGQPNNPPPAKHAAPLGLEIASSATNPINMSPLRGWPRRLNGLLSHPVDTL